MVHLLVAIDRLMLFTNDKQNLEIQRLNGVVYELRMERSGWISDLNVMEAKVASVEGLE
jgi:hypothetical protein